MNIATYKKRSNHLININLVELSQKACDERILNSFGLFILHSLDGDQTQASQFIHCFHQYGSKINNQSEWSGKTATTIKYAKLTVRT